MKIKKLTRAGDTIVEVLIAMAILSLILGAAYATTRRSQQANQASRERSDALRLVEGQIERLKTLLSSDTTIPPSEAFCIGDEANPALPALRVETLGVIDPLTAPIQFAGDCGNVENLFSVAIQRTAAADTYVVVARWNRIGGGDEQITIYYRAYGS